MSKIKLKSEHGSPEGSFQEPKYKQCPECLGEGHYEGNVCYWCEGSGAVELNEEELQMEHEARMEEGHEY
jgi:DnaJ-class molecular chaperone